MMILTFKTVTVISLGKFLYCSNRRIREQALAKYKRVEGNVRQKKQYRQR